MKVFTTEQIRSWDQFTIKNEPIASIDLMDRAAQAFVDWFTEIYADTEQPVCIFAGTGNNGGDGIAVARMLHQKFYTVKVFVCAFSGKQSADFDAQIVKLPAQNAVDVHWLKAEDKLPRVPKAAIVIDALFGSGLTRPLSDTWAELVEGLNSLPNEKLAIDLPTGLFADQYSPGPVLKAARTFSFERPKLAFFFPENADRVGEWSFGSIGLHPVFEEETETPYSFIIRDTARALLRSREKFTHKGNFGHALLINGSLGKMGAAVLAAGACLRSGVGLLTLHTPKCGYEILQITTPEAMCSLDKALECWTEMPVLDPFSVIGLGCGIGQDKKTAQVLKRLLQRAKVPLVLDADALNIIAAHPGWLDFLPPNTILSPHPKEFERLFGSSINHFEQNALLRSKAREHQVYIILKGANTAIACPDGTCWFNSSGNPGMATGGSGDVLTGILAGLLAQGYNPKAASLLGVYVHGLAGDLAAEEISQAGMTSGDLVAFLGEAWLGLDIEI